MTEPIGLTLFWPERLHRSPQRGIRVNETWEGFVRWAADPVRTEHKADEGGFSLAHFMSEERRKSEIEWVYALGLDCDDGTVSFERAAGLLASYRAIVYTTHSSTLDAPRWRAVILFSRAVTAGEYDSIWSHATLHIGAAGIAIDRATKDASRLWYVPAIRPNARYHFRSFTGAPLDVDALLRVSSADNQNVHQRATTPFGSTPGRERVRSYLAKMDPAISGAGGHRAAFRVACFIAANVADENEQEHLYAEYNKRCEPPWSPRELAHKLSDARKRPPRPLENMRCA